MHRVNRHEPPAGTWCLCLSPCLSLFVRTSLSQPLTQALHYLQELVRKAESHGPAQTFRYPLIPYIVSNKSSCQPLEPLSSLPDSMHWSTGQMVFPSPVCKSRHQFLLAKKFWQELSRKGAVHAAVIGNLLCFSPNLHIKS